MNLGMKATKEDEGMHTGDNWRVAAQAGGGETGFFSVIADVVPPGAPDEIREIAKGR